jgi:AcrR family transcriptional regulator
MKKSEKTRKFIIEKSSGLFNKKGIAATSLSDITSATGLTKGSIYGNFSDKDEVALEAFRHNVSRLVSSLTEVVRAEKNYKNKLLAYVNYYKNNAGDLLSQGGCPLLNTSIETDDTHDEIHSEVKKTFSYWQETFQTIINHGIQASEIKQEVDAEKYASLFISIIEGGILLSKAHNDTFFLENALPHMQEIIINQF